MNTHNMSLPHFQYARALLKTDTHFFPGYVSTFDTSGENSMEKCHNTTHNNMMFFMRDATYSICNILFFIYHSWIDLALETKARLIRNDPRQNSKQYDLAKDFLNKPKPENPLNKIGNDGKVDIRWRDYRVMEWLIPDFKEKYKGKCKVSA